MSYSPISTNNPNDDYINIYKFVVRDDGLEFDEIRKMLRTCRDHLLRLDQGEVVKFMKKLLRNHRRQDKFKINTINFFKDQMVHQEQLKKKSQLHNQALLQQVKELQQQVSTLKEKEYLFKKKLEELNTLTTE